MDTWLARAKGWLEKEGYPFEMAVANKLAGEGGGVNQGVYYTDENTKKGREIDVTALFEQAVDNPSATLAITLVIECKYAREKPWILLTRNRWSRTPRSYENTPTDKHGEILFQNIYSSEFSKTGVVCGVPGTGYACVSAHRARDNTKDSAFDGPLAAAAAARSLSSAHTPSIFDAVMKRVSAHIWIPLVVLDGELASASLTGGTDLEMRSIRWGRLVVTNPDIGPRATAVDIVRSDALPMYARRLKRDLKTFAERVAENPSLLTEPFHSLKNLLRGPSSSEH